MDTRHPRKLPDRRKTLLFIAAAAVNVGAIAQTTDRPSELVGHWRKTVIINDSPLDEHLVLKPDGTASNWIVTASSGGVPKQGTWQVQGKELILRIAGREAAQLPYTLHQGQLVYPNIPNRRRFWERI